MSIHGEFERAATPAQAILIAKKFANEAGLEVNMRSVGNHIITSECVLKYHDGRSWVGRGKGLGDQSEASALYECLEHLFHSEDIASDILQIRPLQLETSDAFLVGGCPDFTLLCGDRPVAFTRLPFQSFYDMDRLFDVPAFLMSPNFQSSCNKEMCAIESLRLGRYATNSGTASGLDLQDTLLHSILEIVERDAIGIEFLRTIFLDPPQAVREIDHRSLPNCLEDLVDKTLVETEMQPRIFDITTDINIPSILCMLEGDGKAVRPYFGSGSSLLPQYAVERAVLEAVQTFHIHRNFGVPLPPFMKRSESMSRYQRCYLDSGVFDFRGGASIVSFASITRPEDDVASFPPAKQLTLLIDQLKSRGVEVFWREIRTLGVCVAQAFSPRLERFHLASYGIPIAPGGRGRRILKSSGFTRS